MQIFVCEKSMFLIGFCNKCTQNARDENILCNQMKSMFNSPMDMNDIGTMENFRQLDLDI